jgi:hypothetical protein
MTNSIKFCLGAFAALAVSALSNESQAFRACEDYRDSTTIYGCWPNYNSADRPAGTTPGSFGTKNWEFCYSLSNEGLELHDVMFGSDPNNRRLVANKISLPYLMTRYPQPDNAQNPSMNPTSCGGASGPAFDDTPIPSRVNHEGAEMHCLHAPSTICDLGERACDLSTHTCVNASMSCGSNADCIGVPSSGELDSGDCTGGCVTCRGVCAGTQLEVGGLELWGGNEVVSGSSTADVVLTTTNYYGGYQFTQRYRFKDDGTMATKFRFGGNYRPQWHSHIVYWRFEFDLPGQTGNDIMQRCEAGACLDDGTGWVSRGCECGRTSALPFTSGKWRIFDASTLVAGVPSRSVIIEGGPNDGEPTVCANTDKDYCILRSAPANNEGLVKNYTDCLDGLDTYAGGACQTGGDLSQGGPISFWYLGHLNGHSPCDPSEQGFCEPKVGEESMGPVVRLVGSW